MEDGRHWVELNHGFFSGKRTILVDGEQILQEKKFFDNGSEHDFTMCGHAIRIFIREYCSRCAAFVTMLC